MHPGCTSPIKEKKKRKRFSILWKLILVLLVCIFIFLMINLILNNFALDSYYRSNKVTLLNNSYNKINQISGEDAEAVYNEMYRMELDSGIKSTIGTESILGSIRWVGISNESYDLQPFAGLISKLGDGATSSVITETDPRTNSEIMLLVGRLSNGSYLLLGTSIEAVNASVSISNRFLFISSGIALTIAVTTAFILAFSFIRPIKQISKIAKNVSDLDFSTLYTPRGNDEFTQLGESINVMSHSLEQNISNLKSANIKLKSENELKTKQNEAHSAFISNISHELKTPLAIIQTYAENLSENLDEGIDPEYYCGVIQEETEKMNLMIQKMKTLMQLQSGNEELIIEQFCINNIITEITTKHQLSLGEKNPNISFQNHEQINVWGDKLLIEHVIINYLSNATNHVSDGGEITISLVKNTSNTVRVSVFNTGSSIPEEDIPLIWNSFHKVDKARTREYGGTGIGLSLVKAIMDAHHMPYGALNIPLGVEFYFDLECE